MTLPPDDPVDPDVDLHVPAQRRELRSTHLLLPAIALGGASGASLRHLVAVWWPSGPTDWAWATLLVNLIGALAMGVLMGILEARAPAPHTPGSLARPFLGVGMLGGFTTMSTQAVDTAQYGHAGHPLLAVGYAATTVVGAVGLAAIGWRVTRRLRTRQIRTTQQMAGTGSLVRTMIIIVVVSLLVVAVAAVAGAGAAVGWVALGALIGAPMRYLTDRVVQTLHSTVWPWGTLVVNVLGSLVLGMLVAASAPVGLAVGTGWCGAYTTWSTAAHESAGLFRRGRPGLGVGYPVVSVILCALAAAVGVVVWS